MVRRKNQTVTARDVIEIAELRRGSKRWPWPPVDLRTGQPEFCGACETERRHRSHYTSYAHLCECYGVDPAEVRKLAPRAERDRMVKIQVCLPVAIFDKLRMHDPGVSGACRHLILAGINAGGLRRLMHQTSTDQSD